MNDLCSQCGRAHDHEAGNHVCRRAQRRDRNAPYAVSDRLAGAAVDAAYMEFCRTLGHWNPEFLGQRDALKLALHHAWEISANLIEAAALAKLADQLAERALADSTAVARHPEGSERRKQAAASLVHTQAIIELVTEMVRERDAFKLVEMGGAEDGS